MVGRVHNRAILRPPDSQPQTAPESRLFTFPAPAEWPGVGWKATSSNLGRQTSPHPGPSQGIRSGVACRVSAGNLRASGPRPLRDFDSEYVGAVAGAGLRDLTRRGDSEVTRQVLRLLDQPHFFVARRAYYYLKDQSLIADQRKRVEAFRGKFQDRL